MDFLDPFQWITPEQYGSFWFKLLTTTLKGFWVRFFAFISLFFGIWLIIAKRNVQVGWIFVIISVILTYITGLVMFFFKI